MGTGVGVDCERCGSQLNWDSDGSELGHHTYLDNDQTQHVRNLPVLCHRCSVPAQEATRLSEVVEQVDPIARKLVALLDDGHRGLGFCQFFEQRMDELAAIWTEWKSFSDFGKVD
jgi:hypothetical protein